MRCCAFCGVEIFGSLRRIFCGPKCRKKAMRCAGYGPAALPYDDDIREAVAAKLPAPPIAAKYGVVESTIRNRAYALGLRFDGRAPTPAWHSGAIALHAEGMTDRAIAEHYGVTPSAVATWRKSKGLPINPSYRTTAWHAEALRLQANGYGLQLICDATGHTTHAVRAVLAKHGLTRNDPKRATPAPRKEAIEAPECEDCEQEQSEPEQPEDPDELGDWPASVPAPGLPEEFAIPAVVIAGGELRDSVVHGGRIVHRAGDFIDAMKWARAQKPPCFVVRASDYVVLCRMVAPKKRAKTMDIFGGWHGNY